MWVFVVCGAEEHIQTLNFSLRALKRHTKMPIRVVTDLSRNGGVAIEHDDVVDAPIDPRYNHHQASILLKTGLHRYVDLSPGKRYVYLDTDVVAVRPGVDELFDRFVPPILFCTDHCRMRQFSPTAVRGAEHDQALSLQKRVMALMAEAEEKSGPLEHRLRLKGILHEWEQLRKQRAADWAWRRYVGLGRPAWLRPLTKAYYLLRGYRVCHEPNGDWYACKAPPAADFFAANGYRYETGTQRYFDAAGQMVWDTALIRQTVEAHTEVRWDARRDCWAAPDGRNVLGVVESDTLRQRIAEKFGVHVAEPNWQHWNGGVFVFGAESADFLDTWHAYTRAIFDDPAWKTRDQGTLIASVWAHGLENQPVMPLAFNFLADYHHPTMRHLGNLRFSLRPGGPVVEPKLLHVYHHWGDPQWDVWRAVEKGIV